ncbi:DUF4357 domain-containing protein [Pectinatus cerevisiiphilus]|uniref:Uncharacterized protein DUF4357 n=1 Tax=Pectinatus cerevisiiphilus TaxID=86956 RepID=A0A4V2URH0_9FIRM|nr:DUF4357 domain-containing protein [Pectinatus cerevisiiphilus]TCS77662.1 uncharacterized protein DUF4357 [Pectinatus cerevisiiphilus]
MSLSVKKDAHVIDMETRSKISMRYKRITKAIDSHSIPPGIKKLRQTSLIDEQGILQENVLLNSPSYAASFVIGGHVNGQIEWKNNDGKSLKEIE